jgi:hypothetical protein
VTSYHFLPLVLGQVYGTLLPWVELITGSALILGVFNVPALILSALMSLSFAIANISVLVQGLNGNCSSCFGRLVTLSNISALVIDILMLSSAIILFFVRNKINSLKIGDFFLVKIFSGIFSTSSSFQNISRAALLVVIGLVIGLPLTFWQNAEVRTDSEDCQADFSANYRSVVGEVKITFTDLSKGNVIAWAWDFDGNGTVDSAERNPVHTYSGNGQYTVSLTVRTPDCKNTLTRRGYIDVSGCST